MNFKKNMLHSVFFALCLSASVFVFFRNFFLSNMTMIHGDLGDARFIIYILEHWFQVFQGNASWLSPNFFYPVQHVLGYSEILLGFTPVYSLSRWLNYDPFLSFEFSLISMQIIGFCGFWILLRKAFKIQPPLASLGAMTFAISYNLFVKIGHAQMLIIYLVPWILIGLHKIFISSQIKTKVFNFTFGICFAFLFLSSFYVGYFLALSCLFTLFAWIRIRKKESILFQIRKVDIAYMGFGFTLGIVPFLIVYIPVLGQFGGRGIGEILYLSPLPIDIFNINSNILWGNISEWLFSSINENRPFVEVALGIPYLLLGMFLYIFIKTPKNEKNITERTFIFIAITLWVVSFKIGNVSLWKIFIYNLIPGANSIRAVGRILLFLPIFMIPIVYSYIQKSMSNQPSKFRLSILWMIAILLPFEEISSQNYCLINRETELAKLDVPKPPSNCESFFMYPANLEPEKNKNINFTIINIDAMLLSQKIHIPTINGYSGQIPDNWLLLSDPYLINVKNWIKKNNLNHVCYFDFKVQKWHSLNDLKE